MFHNVIWVGFESARSTMKKHQLVTKVNLNEWMNSRRRMENRRRRIFWERSSILWMQVEQDGGFVLVWSWLEGMLKNSHWWPWWNRRNVWRQEWSWECGGMLFWESKFIFVDAVKVEQDEGLCVGLVVVWRHDEEASTGVHSQSWLAGIGECVNGVYYMLVELNMEAKKTHFIISLPWKNCQWRTCPFGKR